MIVSNRSELLRVLAELCERYPQWRFGQLVSNIAAWADVEIWDVEDEHLLTTAKAHLNHLADRDNTVKV